MRQTDKCARMIARAAAWAIALAGVVTPNATAMQGSGGAALGGPVIASRIGALLDDAAGESEAEPSSGAIVRLVTPASGAQKAGLRVGDVLVECNGETVQNPTDVIRLLHGVPQGGAVRLGVLREATRFGLTVYLDSGDIFGFMAPYSEGLTREGPYLRSLPRGGAARLGVVVLDLTPQLAEYFGTERGVLITSVRRWSPAERAGLKAGDVVVRIGRDSVRTATDFARALHRDLSRARLLIGVVRAGEDYAVEVKILQ
jgi:serine protease Do